jgi:hypothetical protein
MLEVDKWVKDNIGGSFAYRRSYDWSLEDGISSTKEITLISLTCETLPYKFGEVSDFSLIECDISNFTNFPKTILGHLLINRSKLTTLVGLENMSITGNIYLWENPLLESLNEEINQSIMDGFINNKKDGMYIQTPRNRVYLDYDVLMKVERELKLKQFTDNE